MGISEYNGHLSARECGCWWRNGKKDGKSYEDKLK